MLAGVVIVIVGRVRSTLTSIVPLTDRSPATSSALYVTLVVPSVVIGTFVVNGLALALFATVVNGGGGAVDQSMDATPDAASLALIVTVGFVVYQPLSPSVPLVTVAIGTSATVSMRTVI